MNFICFSAFSQLEGEDELLQHAFTLPLQKTELIHAPVNSIDQLHQQLEEYIIPYQEFFKANEKIELLDVKKQNDILEVGYYLNNKTYKAYSYLKPYPVVKSTTAILFIPGSGINQSKEILNSTGYQGTFTDFATKYGDVFIAVKPNEDFLALHNNENKLNDYFTINYMLNKGGSLSATFLINAIATVQYLKRNYDKVYVIGLSQGGLGALLVSLQTSPDACVSSSGFSILREKYDYSNHRQTIIPDIINKYSNDTIYQIIQNQKTQYFFSYGLVESGPYLLEATQKMTCNFFSDLLNVQCHFGNFGHAFPIYEIREFLDRKNYDIVIKGEGNTAYCEGQQYNLSAISEKTIQDLKWYRNDTLLHGMDAKLTISTSGIYQVKANGNENEVYESKPLIINFTNIPPQVLKLESDTIFTSPGYQYEWFYFDSFLKNESQHFLVPDKSGKYHVKVISNDGCSVVSDTIDFRTEELENEVEVYPNPNFGVFNFKLVNDLYGKVFIMIYDVKGRLHHESNMNKNEPILSKKLNIANVKEGLYYLVLKLDGKSFVKKILIEKV